MYAWSMKLKVFKDKILKKCERNSTTMETNCVGSLGGRKGSRNASSESERSESA